MSTINLAICGIGTVGAATLNLIQQQANELAAKTNLDIKISYIGWRTPKDNISTSGITTTTDVLEVTKQANVDIVVELIGGITIAKELVLAAITAGKHVVTANKQLLAEHGDEIFAAAREHNVAVAFEASVAGGIPIIKAIREGLVANNIDSLAGIINGTSNFILTQMAQKKTAFADVLATAQQLGYAEADPSFDINGNDAAHKLALLARLAFGMGNCIDNIYMQGISEITIADIEHADQLGFVIKHLGLANKADNGYQLGVYPALVDKQHLLANVTGVLNAVMAQGDYLGEYVATGAGAGGNATASAVVADIMQVASLVDNDNYNHTSPLYVAAASVASDKVLDINLSTNAYYLRISHGTQPADAIEQLLLNNKIAIEKSINNALETVIISKPVVEETFNQAVANLQQQETITQVISLRVATF
jgi:homoserine dehydrogenase